MSTITYKEIEPIISDVISPEIWKELTYGAGIINRFFTREPHPWKGNLRSMAQILESRKRLPHKISECSDCLKVHELRAKYILSKENECQLS